MHKNIFKIASSLLKEYANNIQNEKHKLPPDDIYSMAKSANLTDADISNESDLARAVAYLLENRMESLPAENEVIETILDSVYIRGVELENYIDNFTNQESGLYDNLVKLFFRNPNNNAQHDFGSTYVQTVEENKALKKQVADLLEKNENYVRTICDLKFEVAKLKDDIRYINEKNKLLSDEYRFKLILKLIETGGINVNKSTVNIMVDFADLILETMLKKAKENGEV